MCARDASSQWAFELNSRICGVGRCTVFPASYTRAELILQMNETGHGLAILITEDRSVIGVISDSDLRRNIENISVRDILCVCFKSCVQKC